MFAPVRTIALLAAGTLLGVGLATPGSAPAATATATARPRYQVSASLQPDTVLVGRRVTVTGRVTPRAPGKTVKLQLNTDGVWHTVAVAGLSNERSRYTATYLPPGPGTYLLRVRKPADGQHRRGASRTLTLTVTPSLPPS